MTLGSWDPNAEPTTTSLQLEAGQLQRFIDFSQNELLDNVEQLLSANEQQTYAGLMQLDKTQWQEAADGLSDTEIVHLMRFLTKAEQLPGWEAGAKSPVIWLGKILKQRGTGIPRELTVWIRANSDNRFIPHGAL